VHEESISGLTEAQAAVWSLGNGSEEMAEEVLGPGGTWARREEKERGERCGKDLAGHHPFIGGRMELGVEASSPVSMPQLQGAGHRSQEGDRV
jgi:hypothetical protein